MPKAKKPSGSNSPLFPSLLLRCLFFLVPLIFFTGTHDPFIIKDALAQIMIAALTTFWSASIVMRPQEFQLSDYPILFPFVLFILALGLSIRNATFPTLALQSIAWQTLLLGLYVSCVQWMSEPLKNKIQDSILWASIMAGTYGVCQHFGIDPFAWSVPWDGRPSSTFGNPNFAAGWWILIAPIFGSKLLRPGPIQWPAGLVVILALLNLVLGQTAGAWAGELIALGIVIALWISIKYFLWSKTTTLFIFLILGLAIFATTFKISAILRPKHQSIQERILKWRTAGRILRDCPILGIGAGNVKVHFATYQADVSRDMKRTLIGTSESNVHNEYLQVAAETGTAGLIAFLSIFIVWLYRWARSEESSSEHFGYLTAVLAFLFFSLTNFPYRITPNACLLIFILAASESKNARSDNFAQKPAVICYFGIAIVCIIIFWKWIWPPFHSDQLRAQAQILATQKNYRGAAELYEKVISRDYYRSERTAYELGECRRALGEIPQAIEAYKISTKLRNYGEVYNNIGNCYYLLGQFSDAKTNWQKAVDLELPDPGVQAQTIENIKAVQRLYP